MAADFSFDRRGNYYHQGLYKIPSGAEARQKPLLRTRSFENVTPKHRRELINYCLNIYTGIPNITAAINAKTRFACSDGCFVEHRSENKAWGKAVELYLNETYYNDCNIQGTNHDFHRTLAEVSVALETHGQVGWIYDTDENGKGSGKIKLISATSIGNGMSPDSTSGKVFELGKAETYLTYWGLGGGFGPDYYSIEKGPFAGNFIIDGIIVNNQMMTLGYRVMGFGADGKPACADLPVGKMNLIFEPKFTDQIMGYPGLSGIVESVATVEDWIYYMGQAMKQSAVMALTRKSKDGRPAGGVSYTPISTVNTDGTASTRIVAHQLAQAGLWELATNNDEEIQAVPFERPSMNEKAFIELIETGFFADHWPRSLLFSGDTGRAGSRVTAIQVQQIIWERHKTVAKFGKQWNQRKIAHAMSNGEIPRNDNLFDAYNLNLSTPAKFSIDEGNDLKGNLSMLSRGLTSPEEICGAAGLNVEHIEAQIFERRERLMKAAIEMAAKNIDPKTGEPIWNPKECLQMLDNLGNANQPIDLEMTADEPKPPIPAKKPDDAKN